MKEQEIINSLQQHTIGEIRIAYEREISQRSLYEFFLLCMKNIYTHIEFSNNWHYFQTCNILQERIQMMLRHEKGKHLLINEPIRSLKTVLISEILPVWALLKFYSEKKSIAVMNVCATQRLASKSSRFSRLIITSRWFQERFPEIRLSEDNKSKSDYSTTNNSTRASFGIDSAIIGQSFDLLIVDDPNDPSEKNSEIAINNVVETYRDVISGRQNREWGLKIILQQRTSSRDLCGFLLDHNRNDYRHVCITAELTKDTSKEFIQFYEDGLFFPTLFNQDRLNQYKSEMTPQAYASQLLQSPSALAGTILLRKWFNPIKQSEFQKLPKAKVLMFLDTAYTNNENNDPTGFYICALIGGKIYVMYAVEKWLEFYELLEEIKELIMVWGIKKVYIEQKASGISITTELKRTLRGTVAIAGINPGSKSKQERASAIQNYLVNGKVIVVEDIWNEAFISQLASFPYGKNDSHVDNLVYSVMTLIAGKKFSEPQTEDRKGLDDDRDFDLYN
jgi:predicted phage terminase large subunit-like protein